MPNRRFVGKILKIGNLRSIEGMSGGPIFGIQKRDGQYYTYVVAIQSKCQGNKYVFGCPTKAVGESIRGVIEDIVADVLAGAEPKPNGG